MKQKVCKAFILFMAIVLCQLSVAKAEQNPSLRIGPASEVQLSIPRRAIEASTEQEDSSVRLGASTAGDFVWRDLNFNGQIDPDEPGIDGILVQIYLDDGDAIFESTGEEADTLLAEMVTGDNEETPDIEAGWYDFDIDFGLPVPYWIHIPDANFEAGNPLERFGLTSGNTIYPIPALLIETQPIADRNDFDFGFALVSLDLTTTLYQGHDGGTSCEGEALVESVISGAPLTYCFKVTNTGESHLIDLEISDSDLGISLEDMSLPDGSNPLESNALAPSETVLYYYEATTAGSLLNTTTATATASEPNGNEFSRIPRPTDEDTAQVTIQEPGIRLEKTVYLGHNSGANCAGEELIVNATDAQVTYCFQIYNTGGTYLDTIIIDDPTLGINQTEMVLLSGETPVAPAATLTYYYQTTIQGDATNTATVTANPTDATGNDLPNLSEQQDSDTAQVDEISPDIEIQKTVYLGHNSGSTCQGGESVIGENGAAITYCFAITNQGDTFLNEISIDDVELEVTQADITLLSGAQPLAPNDTLVYYYESIIVGDLNSPAIASGKPTDESGILLPGVASPMDQDSASIDSFGPGIRLDKTVYIGHDSGSSCDGASAITAPSGSDLTYCFRVTNVGDSYLTKIIVADPQLNLDQQTMTFLTGTISATSTVPLTPDGMLLYYYETTLNSAIENRAITTGNPTDSDGTVLLGIGKPVDDDTATVSLTLGSISGIVWADLDRDGTIGPNEAGIPGVTIRLNTGVSTLTDEDGRYLFENLPDGTYSIIEFDPEGYVSSSDADGGIDNLISGVQVTNGGHVTEQDFFDALPNGSIAGTVWNDSDYSGSLGADEVGIPGVAVTLSSGTLSAPVTMMTDAKGEYLFSDVPAGVYTVTTTNLPTYKSTGDVDGANDDLIMLSVGYGENVAEQDFFDGIVGSISGAIFTDLDNNGVQDANEPGIPNAIVTLNGAISATTDEEGHYTFEGVEPGQYTLAVETGQGGTQTTVNTLIIIVGPGQVVTNANSGFGNPMSIGNRIWLDDGASIGIADNGLFDGDEQGISGVVIHLLDEMRSPILGIDGEPLTTSSDADGYYLFDNLDPGNYLVWIHPENFQEGGALSHLRSSVTTEADSNSDIDSDDNGLDEVTLTSLGISSNLVTLVSQNEPATESDLGTGANGSAADTDSNLTIDFGFATYLSLGNRVWLDNGVGAGQAENGQLDGAEEGIFGVLLTLLSPVGAVVRDQNDLPKQTTTDATGYYLFDDLFPGDYIIRIDPLNFQDNNALAGLTSSVSTEVDPNVDGDSNDNGLPETLPLINGIRSGIINLSLGQEVLREQDADGGSGNASDENSNLTVDFGFFVVVGSPEDPKAVTLISFTTTREEDSILIQWETSSEVDTYGFHLYRTEDQSVPTEPNGTSDAQFEPVRITQEYILGQGPNGGVYRFRDYDIEKGVEYIYHLSETEVNGRVNSVDSVATFIRDTTNAIFLPLIQN
ncbi:MAG: SdrD B-like domain-containing protein [Chloroflexota bacterium]